MNLYPALRSQMGEWNYYVVKMSARELADNVQLASAIYDENILDESIQRTLGRRNPAHIERNQSI